MDENSGNAPKQGDAGDAGPNSRAARRMMERRQSRPPKHASSAPASDAGPQPMQAYIPEVHGPKDDQPKKKGNQSSNQEKKLLGEELRRSIDEDIEDELAEAMASFDSMPSLDEGQVPGQSPMPLSGEIERGTKLTVRVIDVRGDNVFVDLGGKSEGMLSVLQFEDKLPSAGEMIEVIVDRFDPVEDTYSLRRPGAVQEADWGTVEKGMIVDAQVKGVNKGGLEVTVNGIRGFMPAGQADINRIDDLSTLVGKVLRSEVTEANAAARNLIVSRKKVQEREREELAQKTREQIAVGKIFDGVVRKNMDFGAFVDIGGVDGLIHISQISWQKVRHPSEVVREGDHVKVQVVNFDPQSGKLSLSLRQLSENPWNRIADKYAGGSTVSGKVTRTAEFGAFVELEPGIEGLIHISELSGRRIGRVTEVVREGDTVEAKVLEVDTDRQRISLSLKQALAAAEAAAQEAAEIAAEEESAAAEAARPKKPSKPLKGGLGGPAGPLFG